MILTFTSGALGPAGCASEIQAEEWSEVSLVRPCWSQRDCGTWTKAAQVPFCVLHSWIHECPCP